MKNHIVFKFIAIALCALALLTSVASGIGIALLAYADLYENTVEQLQLEQIQQHLQLSAQNLAVRYAGTTLGNCSPEFMERNVPLYHFASDNWYYTLEDADRNLLLDTRDGQPFKGTAHEFAVYPEYPTIVRYEVYEDGRHIESSGKPVSEETSATDPTEAPEKEYLYTERIVYRNGNQDHFYLLGYSYGPMYVVTLYLEQDSYPLDQTYFWDLAQLGYTHRYDLLYILGVSLLLFAITLVYLCCAAGRTPKSDTVMPGGLNMMPLDLYLLLAFGGAFFAGILCIDGIFQIDPENNLLLMVLATGGIAYIVSLLIVGFLFACAAQFKMRHGYWWRHSIAGSVLLGCLWLLKTFFRLLRNSLRKLLSILPKKSESVSDEEKSGIRKIPLLFLSLLRACWNIVVTLFLTLGKAVSYCWNLLCRIFRKLWQGFMNIFSRLPLTWQWLLTGFLIIGILYFVLASYNRGDDLLGLCICIALVLYGAHCFGVLLENTRRMSQGDLDTKVDDKLLIGSFRDYATHLNALAGAAEQAARDKMKSERMKAELITNVSHDIKTPLTSIINYVDLLQKTDSQEEAQQYLEVLVRQSHRLKKLIDDLMELSKASTGNMHVNTESVNAVEALNQALGEFSDKLAQAQLYPIFTPPSETVLIQADGRLTWRVLSNLLGNAVKYALPGTRLYVDLVTLDDHVLISLKNVSKEQLNVTSEELMERFVRGDASRNTEGSGLGLNIAKSLMELQQGQLQLLVDGDLFKVTLVFPAA